MYEEVVIVVKGILWILGTIGVVGAATAVITRFCAPFRRLEKRVEKLEAYQNADHKELQKMETGIEKLCMSNLALTEHALSGNGFDQLRKANAEMQEYLVKK